MTEQRSGDGPEAYGIEEIEVELSISEGKFGAESKSGPKSGSAELFVEEGGATLALNGSGSDRATASLTGPELANFRTMIDAALSTLTAGEEPSALGRDVLSSGYRPLEAFAGGVGVTLESETLRRLGLVDRDGGIAGGTRQVQCTVLGNGTAILNLTGERAPEHPDEQAGYHE